MKHENMDSAVSRIQGDPQLGSVDKIVIFANRDCDSMLEDACLVTGEGAIRDVFWTTSMSGEQADEAAVQLVEGGPDVVAFHESRPSSRDGRPNGIRVHHEDLGFPCVVCNSGKARLTVDGQWVEPGEYTSVQGVDSNNPEAQKALEEFIRSPEVHEEIEEVRREVAKKGGRT